MTGADTSTASRPGFGNTETVRLWQKEDLLFFARMFALLHVRPDSSPKYYRHGPYRYSPGSGEPNRGKPVS